MDLELPLGEWLALAADRFRRRVALRSPQRPDLSYELLPRAVLERVAGLADLPPGVPLLVPSANTPDTLLAFLAARIAGGVAVLAAPGREDEARQRTGAGFAWLDGRWAPLAGAPGPHMEGVAAVMFGAGGEPVCLSSRNLFLPTHFGCERYGGGDNVFLSLHPIHERMAFWLWHTAFQEGASFCLPGSMAGGEAVAWAQPTHLMAPPAYYQQLASALGHRLGVGDRVAARAVRRLAGGRGLAARAATFLARRKLRGTLAPLAAVVRLLVWPHELDRGAHEMLAGLGLPMTVLLALPEKGPVCAVLSQFARKLETVGCPESYTTVAVDGEGQVLAWSPLAAPRRLDGSPCGPETGWRGRWDEDGYLVLAPPG